MAGRFLGSLVKTRAFAMTPCETPGKIHHRDFPPLPTTAGARAYSNLGIHVSEVRVRGKRRLRDIVVIGDSAGRIDALWTIVRPLPANFPCSIFVVIHPSSDYPSMLDEIASKMGMPARLATRG